MVQKAIQAANRKLVEKVKQKQKLSPRMLRFIEEYTADPSNATNAAVRAGYSERSASVLASRLLANEKVQSALADHFANQQVLISGILEKSLKRLDTIIDSGGTRDALKAITTGLHYTKIAAGVLGLKLVPPSDREAQRQEPISVDGAIEALESELVKLREVKALNSAGDANESTSPKDTST